MPEKAPQPNNEPSIRTIKRGIKNINEPRGTEVSGLSYHELPAYRTIHRQNRTLTSEELVTPPSTMTITPDYRNDPKNAWRYKESNNASKKTK